MNVLVLAPHPFYQDRGTPIDVDLLVRALSLRGDHVDLVTYHEGDDRPYPNVVHHRIKPPRWFGRVGIGFSPAKLACDLRLFALARRLVRQSSYDVIHAGEEAAYMALYFKRRRRIPYVYDMDSSLAQQMVEQMALLRPLSPLLNRCEASAIRQSLAVAPVCPALHDLAVERGAAHAVTLHDISQLDVAQLDGDASRESRQLRASLGIRGQILLYVGNLAPYQGIDLLLESFAIARAREVDVELVIAGGSPRAIEKYAARAKQLGLADCVHLIGPWPASELGGLLAQADIVTAPRIRGINTPQKVFPYLHSGKPLLATDLPTHNQTLQAETAYLAPATPAGFAEGILRLAGDQALRERLGKAGRQFVEQNHTFAAHVRRVDQLYDYVAQQVGAPKQTAG